MPMRAALILLPLLLAGCASVLPMDGGLMDDQETTVARCGVANYLFRAEGPCAAPRSED